MAGIQSKLTVVWRLKDGSTQVLTLAAATPGVSSAVGAQTTAIRLSATGANCLVRINQGTAASATQGALIKSSDPPAFLLCGGGDKVEWWGLGTGTLYMDEVTG